MILMVIAYYCDARGEWIVDQATLQKRTRFRRRRVQQLLDELVKAGSSPSRAAMAAASSPSSACSSAHPLPSPLSRWKGVRWERGARGVRGFRKRAQGSAPFPPKRAQGSAPFRRKRAQRSAPFPPKRAQRSAPFLPKRAQRSAPFLTPRSPLFPQTPKSPLTPQKQKQKIRRPSVSGPCRVRRAGSFEPTFCSTRRASLARALRRSTSGRRPWEASSRSWPCWAG